MYTLLCWALRLRLKAETCRCKFLGKKINQVVLNYILSLYLIIVLVQFNVTLQP